MIRSILFLLIILLSAQGASKPAKKAPVAAKSIQEKSIELDENGYILAALDAQARQKNDLASDYYLKLYEKTNKKEYLYNGLRVIDASNNVSKFSQLTVQALKKNPNDVTLKRFAIIALLKSGQYASASQEALALSNETKAVSDYTLLADAYLKMSNYDAGHSALVNAYKLTFDNELADKIGIIQYAHLRNKGEAILFLEQHIGSHGNSNMIGSRLAAFYADSGQYEKAAQMFESVYDLSQDPMAAQEAMKLYAYQNNLPKLRLLLEKSNINDPALLELYTREKQFDKASDLARKLYKKDQNPLYLAQSSVFAYEAAKDKNDPKLLNEVVEGLKSANGELESPLYLNYLGYLMIDHDINVTEGIEYVKRALDKEPNSPFYIDSLAWGHYKLGECVDALRLIKQVESMIGTSEDEVRDHLKAIEKCKTKEKKQ
jgi:uncharacterized protein HemY